MEAPNQSQIFRTARPPLGKPPAPIIVGVARSGTTLLRLMLDSHSAVAVTHEAGFIPIASNLTNPLSRMFYWRIKNTLSQGREKNNLREQFFRTVTEFGNWNEFHVSSAAFKETVEQIEPFSIAEGIRAFFQLYALRFGKSQWGDKTPFYLRHLKRIERLLPEAHFIHIIRDGRDATVSGRGLPFMSNSIETIGTSWKEQILEARKQARTVRNYLEVRYEDLILRTTLTLQKICAFIEIEYEPKMEQYHQTAYERMMEHVDGYKPNGLVGLSKNASFQNHRLVLEPPQSSRIGRWKTEMTKDELATFNRIAGSLLRQLGYED